MRIAAATLYICFIAAAAPVAADNMIATFEDASVWTVAGNDIDTHSASADIVVDASDYTQGSGAIAFTYNFSGNGNFEVGMTKEFDPPLDLSDAMEFAIDIKGDASSQENIQWYALMRDVHGQAIKYYMGSGYAENDIPVHRPKDGEWMTYTFSLAELVWQEWGTTAFRPPSLSKIESVTFFLQQIGAVEDPGTTTVLVDNWRYNTSTTRMTTTVIDQFDYADTTALLGVWSENYSGGPESQAQSEATLNDTDVFQGDGAMELDFNLADGSQNWSTGQRMPLDSPWDVSELQVLEIAIAGDTDIPDTADLMVAFQDTAGNRARWRLRNALRSNDYDRYVLFTAMNAPTQWGAVNAWEEEQWDAGGDLDQTDVDKIVIYMIDGGTAFPWTGRVLVDNFVYHVPTGENIESSAEVTATRNWTIYH